jgi:hypothetical protein
MTLLKSVSRSSDVFGMLGKRTDWKSEGMHTTNSCEALLLNQLGATNFKNIFYLREVDQKVIIKRV